MNDALKVASPDSYFREVLSMMNQSGCRHLPVVKNDIHVGIITDRDIRLAVNSPVIKEDDDLNREEVLNGIRVENCVTPDPQCVSSDTALSEMIDLLTLNKFGAMTVVDEGNLVGMISYIDFLKHYAANR